MPKRVTRSTASQSKGPVQKVAVKQEGNQTTASTVYSNTSNTSKKRSHPVIKSEEEEEELVHGLPSTPNKRAKTKSKSTADSKVKPDLEAGAKLAKSLLPEDASPAKVLSPKSKTLNFSPGKSPYPSYPHPTPEECRDVRDRLESVHGKVDRPKSIPTPSLKRSGCGEVPSILDALIRTRLSANTNDRNSNRAFTGLVDRFGLVKTGSGKGSVDWNKVRESDVSEVFEAIKSGGLAGVKSKDIKAILDQVYEENVAQQKEQGPSNGEKAILSLDHLHSMSDEDVFSKLLGYPGIGPKTASCVLLFCMQRESFAVDTHVFRLTKWLGWMPSDGEVTKMGKKAKAEGEKAPPPVGRETTYAHLDVRIPGELKYPLHYLLIRHGKNCTECTSMRNNERKEAWGNKACPIKDLKRRK